MNNLNYDKIEKYCIEKSSTPSDIANKLETATIENYTDESDMLIGKLEASFLGLLVRLINAKQVLEIGTFTGYSALAFAENLPSDGVVHSLDKNSKTVDFGKNICKDSKHAYKIHYHIGDALETLKTITGNFDIIFLDADKKNYLNYFMLCIERLNKGGIIVIDNSLWDGRVIDPSSNDSDTNGIREVNDFICNSNDLYSTLLPVRDGVFVVIKK